MLVALDPTPRADEKWSRTSFSQCHRGFDLRTRIVNTLCHYILLAAFKSLVAGVRFTGIELRPAQLELLREYLELAKSAMQSEIGEESDGGETRAN